MAAAIENLSGSGFADPVHEAQAVFRAVLDAMARPGTAQPLRAQAEPPPPLTPDVAAIALTLLDQDVSVWLSPSLDVAVVRDYLVFHTGVRVVVAAEAASFVLCASAAEIPPLDRLAQGTADYPDRSATVIVHVSAAAGTTAQATLSGPGLEHRQVLALPGFDRDLWHRLQANHAQFPLGIDLIVGLDTAVMALPRSTAIEVT